MELDDVPRHRPMAFDRMESLVKEMQDPETGVPIRSQKMFLTYIPSAFMGYDLIEWLLDRFNLEESNNVEAVNLGNQLCQYGYLFPVNEMKKLELKDDSSLYRFQSPYYWPWQSARLSVTGGTSGSLVPDNVEYAIYLVKRTLRNKQRHALDDHEQEALANLKKNLAAKWDFITMQAEEQVRLAKDRKKGDKIVSDSQERAYWRVARPPPGGPNSLEPCPVPVRARNTKPKKRTIHHLTREIEHLKLSLDRTRVKTSIALEALMAYSETFAPYDPWLTPPQPSNPWISDDTLFWQINSPLVEVPSEKRVQRWALSIEELLSDPTGLQEFTSFLRKEYSHENIRFWLAVMDLRRSSTKQIPTKLEEIYKEFLKPGAPCEINIDGATAERVAEGLRTKSRYALDHAADHVYGLLLKKDCYPRFVRSDHFQRLLAEGKNVHQKKKFFNFGGGQVKKKPGSTTSSGPTLTRRRGSDRSLSGSAHELAVSAAQPPRAPDPPPHSHSQSNLCDLRCPLDDSVDEALPWESAARDGGARRRQDSAADSGSSSSDVSGVAGACGAFGAGERRRLPTQSTLDGGLRGAAPPLRRLSAVEPRHLAPLASPPPAPRAAPPPAAAPPHPTPTISVSSAPDDSPETAPVTADGPSSVFASADATPTEPALPDDRTVVTSDSKTDISVEVREVVDRKRSMTREPSVASPTSSRDGSRADSASLPLKEEGVRAPAPSGPATEGKLPPAPCEPSVEEEKGPPAPSGPHAEEGGRSRASSGPSTEEGIRSLTSSAPSAEEEVRSRAASGPSTEKGVKSRASSGPSAEEGVRSRAPSSEGGPAEEGRSPSRPRAVAPLAEGEDLAADDDPADKVPSPRESDATKPIAHKDELSSVSKLGIVKRDNKSDLAERKQRNDICPWEDENSCESDAPFVKTYATLGYL